MLVTSSKNMHGCWLSGNEQKVSQIIFLRDTEEGREAEVNRRTRIAAVHQSHKNGIIRHNLLKVTI